jgi:DNA helicase-2/ATP-dependent DNA helicase PcrA
MDLNTNQRLAAEYQGPAKHLLVLAGAGTGKTRTIIGRTIHLLKNNVPAKTIILLTFTRRSAAEMTHRLELEVGELSKGIFAGTFHRFCLDIMKTVPKSFGVESYTIIDRDDQLSLIKLIRGHILRDRDKKNFPQAARILELYSYSRNTCVDTQEYLEKFTEYDDSLMDALMQIFIMYEKRKKDRNYIDFDDILHIFLDVISKKGALLNKLKSLFTHILVDEMQDTNPLQWGILEKLANPAQLFCVGDDAQSIYAFRGADFQNVHSFKERMPDSDILKLDQNYRSTQEILDMANWLIDQSPLDYNRKLSAVRGTGNSPVLCEFRNYFDEAAWYGNEIQRRHSEGTPYTDFMVLVRTAYLARRIEAVFVEMNIPYRFIGGTQLMQSAHVRDLFSLLRVVINYRDELAWIRYLKMWPRVGDVTAAKAIEGIIIPEVAESGYQYLTTFFSGEGKIAEAVRDVRKNLAKPNKAINQALKYLVPMMSEKYDHWSARVQDLLLIERLSKRFSGLQEFIETYTLDPVYNKEHLPVVSDDAVTIITIHSAKGTEAPVCMIPQAVPGVYPHSRALGKADEIEEERRVLYVALTRAENELILTRAGETGRNIFFGGSGLGNKDHINYFLTDLPAELIKSEFIEGDDETSFLDALEGFE